MSIKVGLFLRAAPRVLRVRHQQPQVAARFDCSDAHVHAQAADLAVGDGMDGLAFWLASKAGVYAVSVCHDAGQGCLLYA